ncbi:hypothetical protein KDX31_05750 [Amphritea atlantica]|uniref:Uncharacterized protein n=1 Tax=Amphritea atlantica TaxID=355243 RepID=A0ABY5GXL6_9GAMM|nr:hypothetical protein KDX31_05750 [Amphritea atlantica]
MVRFIKWFWRGWPFWIVMGLAYFHYFMVSQGYIQPEDVNPRVALVSQIMGGLLVLASIDSNIGLFHNKNLWQLFIVWLKDFPMFSKNKVIQASMTIMETKGGAAFISAYGTPETLEEKVELLFKQVDSLRHDLTILGQETKAQINKSHDELREVIQQTQDSIEDVKGKMTALVTDGIKVQYFGVNMLIYGSITSYFT